jgi:hypothetical protein
MLYIFVRRNVMHSRTCRSFKSAFRKKIRFANRKSSKGHICGRSANLTNLLICDCGSYLRIAQFLTVLATGRSQEPVTEIQQ